MQTRCVLFVLMLTMGRCASPTIVATQSIQEGDLMNNQNRYAEAIRHYEAYLEISPQLGLYRNPSQEASVSRKLAHAYATQGKYRQSFSYLLKALATDSAQSANRLEVIDDYRQLGVVKAYMGDYPQALRYLNRSLELNEGMEKSAKDLKKASLADTYLSLAQVNLTLGNFRDAGQYANKALAIYSGIPKEAAAVMEANLTLGIVQRDLGNLDEAAQRLQASEEAARRLGLNRARQHQALGEIYFMKGEPEAGIRHKMIALEEAERSGIKPQMVMMYLRMGDAWQELGDAVKAEFFYRKAISLKLEMDSDSLGFIPAANMRFAEAEKAHDYYTKSGATMGIGLVSLRLGELRASEGNADSALIMFSAARDAFTRAGSREGMAKASLEVAHVHARSGNYQVALRYLAEAASLTSQPDLAWQIKFREGTIAENTGSFDSAYQHFKDAIAIIDQMRGNMSIEEFKTLFANTKVEVYEHMIVLLLSQKLQQLPPAQALAEAFNYNEQARSRTFLDMLGNKKIEPKNTADTALLEREQLLRLKIGQLSKQQQGTDDITQQAVILAALEQTFREFDHVTANIKLNNPAYATLINVSPPAIEEIQHSLDAETALLEYWVSGESVIVWVLTADEISSVSVPVSKAELQRQLRGCRNAIAYKDAEMMQQSLKAMHSFLIRPVLPRIRGLKKLVIVPHRGLHFLPYQALLSEKNTFLVEDFIITYAPASSIYYYCRQRETARGASFLGLALGDLTIGKHPNLPGTEAEVRLLSQLYPQVESKYGDAFQETYVKKHIPNFDYVHIATHGIFNPQEPVYSYLLMAATEEDDGKLTVGEIFGLDLSSRFVTLSACETALGELSEGDELVGLSRAFIYAGSSAVLVSLWNVEDTSTALLMARMHQYISLGNTAAEALCLAQRDLIHKKFLTASNKMSPIDLTGVASSINAKAIDSPFYWAPFILIGNGDVK